MAVGISCENDLGNMMIAVNHEAKAIVLGGMQPGEAYGATALHRDLFLAPQGTEPAYVGTLSNRMQYCTLALEPAGFVTRAPAETIQYTLTDFGEREGKALAGHALALSLEASDLSLRSLFGAAQTQEHKDSRPPVDRLHIFRMLLASGDVQASDVRAELDLNIRTVVKNLDWLDEHGIIEYQAVDGRDISEHLFYELPRQFTPDNDREGTRKIIQDTIVRMVDDGIQECSQAGIMERLRKEYPDEGFDRLNRRKYAQRILNELADDSRITKGSINGTRKSSVTLQNHARAVVEQAVAIADGMLSGHESFMRDGREQLEAILADEERVRTLIRKAFTASPSANGVPLEERQAHVTACLAGQAASSSELMGRLKAQGMTAISTRKTLVAMREKGLVTSETIPGGRELVWELAAPLPKAT